MKLKITILFYTLTLLILSTSCSEDNKKVQYYDDVNTTQNDSDVVSSDDQLFDDQTIPDSSPTENEPVDKDIALDTTNNPDDYIPTDEEIAELPDDGMGPGSSTPYETTDNNSNGVGINDDGELELDMTVDGTVNTVMKFLWASNSDEGTVSKVDVETLKEVARYRVGRTDDSNPSRTSVDLAGDVFVGCRDDSTVTKIAAYPVGCIDRNNNGVFDTSKDLNENGKIDEDEILPRDANGLSTDECVVWTKHFQTSDVDTPSECKGIRGVAATPETGTNYEFNGHVWIGCRDSDVSYKLNGNTGEIMDFVAHDNCGPYGFVLDRDDHLYASCRNKNKVAAWIDYNTNRAANEIKEPSENELEKYDPYGIAVDGDGNVWVSQRDGHVARYIPDQTEFANHPTTLTNGVWESVKVEGRSFRGVAVDVDGFVWAIATDGDSELYMINTQSDAMPKFPDPNSIAGPFPLGNENTGYAADFGTGVALDSNDHVWGISHGGPTGGIATRLKLDRSSGVPEVVEQSIVEIGLGPYMYSDFTGYSLANFGSKEGWFRQFFKVCPTSYTTRWKKIYWEGNAPANTRYVIRVRAHDELASMGDSAWFNLVEVPSDASPKDIPENMPEGLYLQTEVRLYSIDGRRSPTIGKISFDYECLKPR